MTKSLYILDPGLGALSGHHAGFLEKLRTISNGSVSREGEKNEIDLRFHFYGHKSYGVSRLIQDNLRMIPFFTVDFYEYIHNQAIKVNPIEYQQKLAAEYYAALVDIANSLDSTAQHLVQILMHSIDYIHAIAFDLALNLFEERYKKIHLQCSIILLFHPLAATSTLGCDEECINHIYDKAFNALNSRVNCQFYASEYETSICYSKLFNASSALPVAPCIVPFSENFTIQPREKLIILYMGDAKADKGFTSLPLILETLSLSPHFKEWSFLIQYTAATENGELTPVFDMLRTYDKKFDNVDVISSFVDDEQISKWLLSASLMAFNYSVDIYKYKNSGLLWLAAYYNVPIFMMGDNWLSRELKRLGAASYFGDMSDLSFFLEKDDLVQHSPLVTVEVSRYRLELFSSFETWILGLFKSDGNKL